MLKKTLIFALLLLITITTAYAQDPTPANAPQPPPPPGLFDALSDLGVRLGKSFTITCTDPNDGATCRANDPTLGWQWFFEVWPDTGIGCPQAFPEGVQPTATRAYRYVFTYEGVEYDYRQSADRSVLFLCTETGREDAQPSVAISPAEQCPIIPRLTINAAARVTGEDATPNNVRSGPGVGNEKIGEIPAGATFTVLDGPVCTPDYTWWQVNYNGLVGWTVEGGTEGDYYLEPVPAAPPVSAQPITVANAAGLQQLNTQSLPLIPTDLDYSPVLDRVAVPSGQNVMLYRPFAAATEAPVQVSSQGTLTQAAFHPAGTMLGAVEYNPTSDALQLRLWMVTPGQPPGLTPRLNLPVTGRRSGGLAFNPAGTRVAIGGTDGTNHTVHIYDPAGGTSFATLPHTAAPVMLEFSPDGRLLAVVDESGMIHLWATDTFARTATLEGYNLDNITGGIQRIAFDSSGTRLAYAGTYPVVQVWDVAAQTAAQLIFLPDSEYAVYALDFSADGAVLMVSAGNEILGQGKLYLFNASSGDVLFSQPFFVRQMLLAEGNLLHTIVEGTGGSAEWVIWGVR